MILPIFVPTKKMHIFTRDELVHAIFIRQLVRCVFFMYLVYDFQ